MAIFDQFLKEKPSYVVYIYLGIFLIMNLLLLVLVISMIINKIRKKETKGLSKFIAFITPNIIVWILIVIAYIIINILIPDLTKYKYFPHISKTFIVLSVGYLFYRCGFVIKFFIDNWNNKASSHKLNFYNIKWVVTLYHFLVVFVILLIILAIFNIKLTALVAGLGIGGVAIALASQDTLSNILGFVIILLDKPFVIGQRIKILGYDGNIEEVGVRSSKLRTLDGNLVIIPNKTIGNAEIENIGARETIRQFENIELDCSTIHLKDLPKYIEKIKEILAEEMNIRNDYRVYFDNSDGAKIIIKMWYWMASNDYWVYMEAKERINYAICDLFDKDNVLYWMPTSKILLDDFNKNNVSVTKPITKPKAKKSTKKTN